MARSLDLHVITDGIETREHLQFLQQAGCPKLPGHLFSQLLPPDAMQILRRDGSISLLSKLAACRPLGPLAAKYAKMIWISATGVRHVPIHCHFDWYPLFHYGFLFYHFHRDPATGAKHLLEAVPRVNNVQDQWALQNLVAIWIEKGYQTGDAAAMVEAMAADSPAGNFRNYLQVRARRLRDLEQLQNAAGAYRERFGRRPERVDDLVTAGLLREIPKDQLGYGFGLDASGVPVLNANRPPDPAR
ncbi:MAG: hypothetical protein J5X22_00970 [Candidatus Accumulibacter sp.]|nr:hypothetical protein [Accumulibacter sp.]